MYSVYRVYIVQCTVCTVYSVYSAQCVQCTVCRVYRVYSVMCEQFTVCTVLYVILLWPAQVWGRSLHMVARRVVLVSLALAILIIPRQAYGRWLVYSPHQTPPRKVGILIMREALYGFNQI